MAGRRSAHRHLDRSRRRKLLVLGRCVPRAICGQRGTSHQARSRIARRAIARTLTGLRDPFEGYGARAVQPLGVAEELGGLQATDVSQAHTDANPGHERGVMDHVSPVAYWMSSAGT